MCDLEARRPSPADRNCSCILIFSDLGRLRGRGLDGGVADDGGGGGEFPLWATRLRPPRIMNDYRHWSFGRKSAYPISISNTLLTR